MQSSGQTDEYCRRMAEKEFPVPGLYKEFTYWNCYEVLMDSEKFRAGVDAGWPKKQRLNYTGDYSGGSSGGSHDLPEDAQEFLSPQAFARRTRPIGQRRAQRAHWASQEVQSTADLAFFARQQTHSQMWTGGSNKVITKKYDYYDNSHRFTSSLHS
ncbi:uncharacterized protein LOC121786460 [Salvia splendens]|uniref:uncharacterized protein LOC121786460 n=1 Tax=Salvia splendens TaxID=180675 RepID=UPI001C27D6AA|nr:uncharacterized protein LOC121786460 [Salvia splendens]